MFKILIILSFVLSNAVYAKSTRVLSCKAEDTVDFKKNGFRLNILVDENENYRATLSAIPFQHTFIG